jgi:hypothetical protein
VNAGSITFGPLLMAVGAGCGLCRLVVVGMVLRDINVATRAGVRLVDRGSKFFDINKERDNSARCIGLGEILIGMAVHAGTVFDGLGGGQRQRNNGKAKETKSTNFPSSNLNHIRAKSMIIETASSQQLLNASHLLRISKHDKPQRKEQTTARASMAFGGGVRNLMRRNAMGRRGAAA